MRHAWEATRMALLLILAVSGLAKAEFRVNEGPSHAAPRPRHGAVAARSGHGVDFSTYFATASVSENQLLHDVGQSGQLGSLSLRKLEAGSPGHVALFWRGTLMLMVRVEVLPLLSRASSVTV